MNIHKTYTLHEKKICDHITIIIITIIINKNKNN